MTEAKYLNIHDRARAMAAQRGIALPDAYAELARRSAIKRARRNHGVLRPTATDRSAFQAVESPRYWWHDR